MTDGRPIRGDGVDNMQDYVEERLTDASDSDEYAAANRTLEQELADLRGLQAERGQPHARPNINALIDEAQLRVDRLSRGEAARVETGSGSQDDPRQLSPDAEARSVVSHKLDEQTGYGNIKP